MIQRLLLAAVLITIPAMRMHAKDVPHTWETGRVIAQNQESSRGGFYTAPIGTGIVSVPIMRHSNTVEIDAGSYRYTWMENTAKSHGYIVLPVGQTIQFYRDKNWFIVIDTQRKKHYFAPMAQRVLEQ